MLLLAALLPAGAYAAESVAIDEVNFPDEIFRSYVKEYCDTDGDMLLSPQELEKTVEIDVSGKAISSLQGIELFTELEYLNCGDNQLTELDISGNRKLIQLFCVSNQLAFLNVTNNEKLEMLYCYYNRLTELDVTQNAALKELYCNNNQLTGLNLKNNSVLEYLTCNNNALSTLDLSNNPALTNVFCYDNQIADLDISKNEQLVELSCKENQLSVLDTNGNPQLQFLFCNSNQLTSMDISASKQLKNLFCGDNYLTTLDLNENTSLEYFDCGKNQLERLDVSMNAQLKAFNCEDNRLINLILNENAPLQTFTFGNNQLTELNGVPMSVSVLEGDFQYVPAQMQWSAEGWTVDFNKLVSIENLDKIELNPDSGWIYNQNTGKAVFKRDTVPDGMAYYYFGYPDGMEVRLSLTHEIVCVVMKENAEKAVVNGLLSPTTQYASGYARMVNNNGTMQIPLRYIAEINRCPVHYDESTGKTKVTRWADGRFIMITQGSKLVEKYYATGDIFFAGEAPLPFTVQNGVTMGPLRFTCEVLGLNVAYQETAHGNYVVISPVAKTPEEALEKIEEAYQLGL